MADLDIAEYLRPGDTVLIGQAAAEPPVLVEKFIAAARDIGGLTAFCGYTSRPTWRTPPCAISPRKGWWRSSLATTAGSRN